MKESWGKKTKRGGYRESLGRGDGEGVQAREGEPQAEGAGDPRM